MKKKILVIEDDSEVRELVEYNLQKEGYQVVGAATGEAGLEAAAASQPDLVVLDLMLPGLDGLEVCRLLKNRSSTSAIPIIMLTVLSKETDIIAGLEVGADDYVTKPFSPKVLIARIRTRLRRKAKTEVSCGEPIRTNRFFIDPVVTRSELMIDWSR